MLSSDLSPKSRVQPSRTNFISSGKWPTWWTILFSYMFISILYMFRATPCSSSGESVVSIQLLVYVTLCRWPSSMQVGKELQTRRSPTHSDIYQKLHSYNWFSWWWASGCSKHVEDWNKHIWKKNCLSSWSFTRIIPRRTVNNTQKFTSSFICRYTTFMCFRYQGRFHPFRRPRTPLGRVEV
jgi:hypothetical protein